jgi:hypothetical protein
MVTASRNVYVGYGKEESSVSPKLSSVVWENAQATGRPLQEER